MFKTLTYFPNYEINELGIIRSCKNKKIKSQYVGSTGYYMVTFSINNKSKPVRVHRLLALEFILNPDNKPCVNHKDGNKLNNSLDNLEWVTHPENMKHAFKTGLVDNTGEKNGMSKLTEEQVKKIKLMLSDGISQYKIAKKIGGISRSSIMNIKNNHYWNHVKI